MAKPDAQPVSLALQGGGAHGAYTWGVLDRLAEEDRFEFPAITATSAGALNAVAWAAGMAENGREGARAKLESLWAAVSKSSTSMMSVGALSPILFAYASAMQSLASPYDFNPLNFNPLRRLVEKEIDFEAVHASGVQLFLSATNVETGHAKVFQGDEITADAVLASACLPQTFQAVEIGGEAFWDGGYMGNPSLYPLIYAEAPRDVLLIILNPIHREGVPKRAGEIQDRINEISFNAALIGELRAIAFVQKLVDDGMLKQPLLKKFRRLNIHAVNGGEDLKQFSLRTKYDTSWKFLTALRDLGREAAGTWLGDCARHVGTDTSSLDLREDFLKA